METWFWRVLLVAIILIVFRNQLRPLRPYWRTLVAAGAGAAVGVAYIGLMARVGVVEQAARALGLGPRGFGLIVVAFSALMGALTFGPVIHLVFPDRRD